MKVNYTHKMVLDATTYTSSTLIILKSSLQHYAADLYFEGNQDAVLGNNVML